MNGNDDNESGGLSRLRGHPPVAHQKIIELVREWFPEVDQNDQSKRITRQRFTDFCLQENGVARQVFQLYAEAEGDSGGLMEDELNKAGPTKRLEGGGDEFMAIKVSTTQQPPFIVYMYVYQY